MPNWLDEFVDTAKAIPSHIDEFVESARKLPPIAAARSNARRIERGIHTAVEVAGKATGVKAVEDYGRRERQEDAAQEEEYRSNTTRSKEFEDFTKKPGFDTFSKMMSSPDFYKFAVEQGVGSIPDMAMSVVLLPAYIATRTGNIAEERAGNEGRTGDIKGSDFLKSLPAGALAAWFERWGTGKLLSPNPVDNIITGGAKRTVSEGASEAGDEVIEYTGESFGTEAGFDPKEARARAIGGAVIGGPMGAGVGAVTHPRLRNVVLELEGGGTVDAPKTSPKGALGPMQVMPETARKPGFGIRPWDGRTQEDLVRVGEEYLAAMNDKYDGDTAKVLAAYNAGPGRVDNAVKRYGDNWLQHMPAETRKYVDNGLNKLHIAPDGLPGNQSVPPMEPSEIARIMDDPDADLTREAPDERIIDGELRASDEDVVDIPESADVLHTKYSPDSPEHSNVLLRQAEDNLNMIRGMIHRVQRGAKSPGQNIDILKETRQYMLKEIQDPIEATPEVIAKYEETLPYLDELITIAGGDRSSADLYLNQGTKPSDPANDLDAPKGGGGPGRVPLDMDAPATFAGGRGNPLRQRGPRRSEEGHPNPPQPQDIEPSYQGLDPDQKVRKGLQALKPLNKEQRALYRQARKVQTAKLAQLQERLMQNPGDADVAKMKAQLKGELPKVEYASIRHNFTPDDIGWLKSQIYSNNRLYPQQKMRAVEGLDKLLGKDGVAMPTNSEQELLEQVFGEDLFEGLFPKTVANVLNLPRAIMASADISAPFRQGIFMIGRPKQFFGAFPDMLKSFGSKRIFDAVQEEIRNNPYYELFDEHGLALTLVGKDARLQDREEAFMTRASDHLPVVKQSNRAYVAYLNKLRADVATSILKKWEDAGVDIYEPKRAAALFDYINTATGRGSLGKWNRAAPLLNTLFFSSRLIASRFKLINPFYYLKLYRADPDHLVFKEAMRDGMSFAAVAGTALSLAVLAGAEVEDDPKDASGLKIKINNSRIDISGGIVPWIRLYANIGKFANDTYVEGIEDKSPFKQTAAKRIGQFFRNKESPVVSFLHDLADGQNAIGEDVRNSETTKKLGLGEVPFSDAVISRMTPMITQSALEAYYEHTDEPGPEGLVLIPFEALGMSVNTYKDKKSTPKGGSIETAFESLDKEPKVDSDMEEAAKILEDL